MEGMAFCADFFRKFEVLLSRGFERRKKSCSLECESGYFCTVMYINVGEAAEKAEFSLRMESREEGSFF